MSTVTQDTLHLVDHFIARSARLLDRYRFAHHFQGGPAHAVYAVLDTYRNVDGGYGNALDPELRGHGSQPLADAAALRVLDELGPLPHGTVNGLCRHLGGATRPGGGVPPVLPDIRHTETAPWWREHHDFRGALNPTATIAGLLHKHHISNPWRDRATSFCWTRIRALNWTDPEEAAAVCTFLQHVPDRDRARAEFARLSPVIRVVIARDPDVRGYVHTPLDLAPTPGHIARSLFTDAEIDAHLDALLAAQEPDGGWPVNRPWAEGPTAERRGSDTLRHLLVLSAYGRVGTHGSSPVPSAR
ncbi:prenyltransferase [Actinorugispora endophytica]|uniref:Prenyltransferase n=1 Tax=Actinorugispora endophytica TaxID=1605990 RepID=A0A4R6UN33_9ACTN|nr:prenyltransferase [Actinorugispora endophytica]TDQ48530.1 hypothetical protein EV190_11866 [Actinorugispora endophytica]